VSEPSTSAVRVGSVVINCNDFDRMFAFWREALGDVPRDESERTGSCSATRRVLV
jgi:catechol-2,3-dioxygenase